MFGGAWGARAFSIQDERLRAATVLASRLSGRPRKVVVHMAVFWGDLERSPYCGTHVATEEKHGHGGNAAGPNRGVVRFVLLSPGVPAREEVRFGLCVRFRV